MNYPTPLRPLVERYIFLIKNEQEASKFRSALLRYFIPCLGGPEPQGLRAKTHEIQVSMSYLEEVSLEQLRDVANQLELFFESRRLEKAKRRVPRSLIKKFLDQVKVWEDSKKEKTSDLEENNIQKSTLNKYCRSTETGRRKPIVHGQKSQAPFALMAKKVKSGLVFPDDYINKQLEEDLKKFSDFRTSQGWSPKTIKIDMAEIYRILGWLHRYKNIALEDLRLTTIIIYSPLVVKMGTILKQGLKEFLKTGKALNQDTYNEYIKKKAMARELAGIEADETIELIEEYLNFYGNHPRTKVLATNTFIQLANFVYHYEVGTDEYPENRDIPVCKKLMALQKKLSQKEENTPDSIPHDKKKIAWKKALEVLLMVKNWHKTKTMNCGNYRTDEARAKDLQRFLMLAFFLLMPPDRSRTYYELELDKTLVHGFYDGINFVPINQMKNSEEAKWYIHLEPNDYKTGKTYGCWWGEVPNTKFPDGTTFYSYIELWLNWGREVGQKVEHNRFFRGVINYAPLNVSGMSDIIKRIFDGCTGIPVTPKEIRKMYVSYLKDQGATEAELEAAACAMHHSRRMQSKIYDNQEQFKKIRPAFEMSNRLTQNLFSEFTTDAP